MATEPAKQVFTVEVTAESPVEASSLSMALLRGMPEGTLVNVSEHFTSEPDA